MEAGLVENNWSASNSTFEIYREVLDAKKLLHFLYSTIKVTVDARNVENMDEVGKLASLGSLELQFSWCQER